MRMNKGFSPLFNPQKVCIELPCGELVDIDFTKPIPKEALFAKFIIFDWRSLWECISFFHKSLRLGDVELSLCWGKIYAAKASPKAVIKYLRKICFEETRSLALFELLVRGTDDYESLIVAFARSAKKWEVEGYSTHMDLWNRGYEAFHSETQSGVVLSLEKIKADILKLKDHVHLYKFYYQCQTLKEHESSIREVIRALNNRLEIEFLFRHATKEFGTGYPRMLGLELMFNYWDPDANLFNKKPYTSRFYIPAPRPWGVDIHVRKGKSFLKANWDKIKPNMPFPSKEVDLRLSGLITGTAFRFKCPKPLTKEWHEVHFSEDEWRLIRLHETRYYKI